MHQQLDAAKHSKPEWHYAAVQRTLRLHSTTSRGRSFA